MIYLIVTVYLLIVFFFTVIIILRSDGALFDLCMLMFHIHRRIFGLPPRHGWMDKTSKQTANMISWMICKLSPEFRPKWLRFFLD
jgi:hypothetical protein